VLTNWISYSLNFSGTVSFVSYNRRRHFIIIIIAFVICSPSGATWTYVIHIFSLTNVGTTVLFLETEKSAEICHVASIGALQMLLDMPHAGSLTSRQLLTGLLVLLFVTPYAVSV
jgi:hypothetical protein